MKPFIVLLSAVSLLTFSCSGDAGNDDDYEPTDGQFIHCIVDGNEWRQEDDSVVAVVTNFSIPLVSIQGAQATPYSEVSIYLPYPLTVQDTTIYLSSTGSALVRYGGAGTIYQSTSGSVQLHREPSNAQYVYEIFTGTFSAYLKDITNFSGNDSIQITSGSFEGHRLL